jgi:hypothetical protein
MAKSKLTVMIQHDEWIEIARSSNPRTVQACLSLIANETPESPPSPEAVALEAAERQIRELKAQSNKLECEIIDLKKKVPAPPAAESVGVPKGDLFA